MDVLRLTAFSSDPAGGNPAGVVLDATGLGEAEQLAVAAEVGFSETAFLVPRAERDYAVRYFSPLAEVPFCGHATIAAGVALAERIGPGALTFHTPAGRVELRTTVEPGQPVSATLVSVAPRTAELSDAACSPRCDGRRATSIRPCPRAWPTPERGTRLSPLRLVSGWPSWTTTSRPSPR